MAQSDYSYTYDTVNRVKTETWSSVGTSGGVHNYSYDTTNQLTQADTASYSYADLNGNRQTAEGSHLRSRRRVDNRVASTAPGPTATITKAI